MNRGLGMTIALLVAVCCGSFAQEARAQEAGAPETGAPETGAPDSRPASRPSSGLETLPVRLDLRALDATASWSGHQSHGGDATSQPKVHAIADTQILIYAVGENGIREKIESVTDSEGRFAVDLGNRYRDTEVTVYAIRTTGWFVAFPLRIGEPIEPDLSMYAVGESPKQLRHDFIYRIVTEQTDDHGHVVPHVRQILGLTNRTFSAFLDRDTGGYVFPVPRGARVVSLRVNGQDILDKEPIEHKTWGHGVPIRQTLFPAHVHESARLQIRGTYVLEASEGDELDFDLSSPVPSAQYVLALEKMRFSFEPTESPGPALVAGPPAGPLPGVSQEMVIFEVENVPGGTTISARVRYGKPPISNQTIFVTLAIVLALGFTVFLAVTLSRSGSARRAAAEPDDVLGRLTALDRQLARGEVTAAEYESSRQELSAPPSGLETVAERLDAIAARRPGQSPETLAQDIRTLAAIVRDHVTPNRKS